MDFEIWQWALFVLATVIIGMSKTGIPGLGILAVAVFANLLPAKEATGLVLPLLIFADVFAVLFYRRHAEWKYFLRLFPWAILGVFAGYFALKTIDDVQAKIMIGTILLIMLVVHFVRKSKEAKLEKKMVESGAWFAPFVGIAGGFATTVANAAGPIMILYLLAVRLPKMAFMGTAAVYFLILNTFKVPFLLNLDLITTESLMMDLYLLPAILVGAYTGKKIIHLVDQVLFERLALLLTLLAALKLFF
ncbi:MAG: sulfite exporter TauE/SafE family protein [Opitutaceae bacterium]|nr:sulfite exporter TauE/SafE family protein [Opitutaceae bacterium]